jgi:hypothetical protein
MSVYIPSAHEIAGNVVKELKRTASGRRAIEKFGKQIQADRERQQAAKALEDQAAEWEAKVEKGAYGNLDPELLGYYRDKAKAARREAARLRGEAVEPEPGKPVRKSVTVTLPR